MPSGLNPDPGRTTVLHERDDMLQRPDIAFCSIVGAVVFFVEQSDPKYPETH